MSPDRCLIITGGLGYVGRAVVERALAEGSLVTVLSRTPEGLPAGVRHACWRLGDRLPAEAMDPRVPRERQTILHVAHDWRDARDEENVNLVGARILRDDARREGVGRFIFISSVSARADALNAYGRCKWRIEQLLDGPNELSLRVGLVYGGPLRGQYGLLCRVTARTGVLPMVAPRQLVQPIHRAEVAEGILLAADSSHAGVLTLSGPPVPFCDFLDALRLAQGGGRMLLIPAPLKLMLLLCGGMNALPFGPKVDRERLLGLAGTRPMSPSKALTDLGLCVAPVAERFVDEPPARRAIIREASLLGRYVMRRPASSAFLRRYARAIASSRRRGAMRLPFGVRQIPALLRFLEPWGGDSLLGERLRIATKIASEPLGHGQGSGGRPRRLAGAALDLLLETTALPARWAAHALRR